MAQSKSNPTVHRRGRVFSEIQWSPEKIAQWQAEKEELYQRCQLIFDRLKPELFSKYNNGYVVIEPNSETYILDFDEITLLQKVLQTYPHTQTFMFKVNKTGVFGTI
ncbi:hypothetical protein [Coleofasciculus sp. E1-EBD-02]|uniref:hypothetical protein n=1 Tax=Coleofasciculus sp. E1-EBD-02 TaxID=3068481 RepID=UPI0032F7EF95